MENLVNKISGVTKRVILQLYQNGHPDKAILVGFRDSTSITDYKARVTWPILFKLLDEDMLSQSGKPTYAEVAIFSAVHFYAQHQQGQQTLVSADSWDNDNGALTLFKALALMRQSEKDQVRLDRRVATLLSMTNITGTINALARIIAIVKAQNRSIKIDYPALAADLYRYQLSFEQARRVAVRWGQDYYGRISEEFTVKG